MMKTMNFSYRIAIGYILTGLFLVTYNYIYEFTFCGLSPNDFNLASMLFCMFLFAAHYGLNQYQKSLLPFGKVFMNFTVIDCGPFGEDFELPEHLCLPFPHWVSCSPSQVKFEVQRIKDQLTKANNVRFVEDQDLKELQIVVKSLSFRVGDRCNETKEQYLKFVTETLEKERMDFFMFIDEGKEIDPNWINKNYLEKGYNGSVMSY